MDFEFGESQQAVADVAASVLIDPSDWHRVEQALASDTGYDETLWKAMAQGGLLSLALPTELGGDGLGVSETAIVLTQVGRTVAPVPALATLALGVLPLVRFGTPGQQRRVLGPVADGAVLTAATRAIGPIRHTDGTLSGSWTGVPFAAQASRILIPTETGVALVEPSAAGVVLTRTPSSTGSPEYAVQLDGVRVTGADVLAASPRDVERYVLAGAIASAEGVIGGALALTSAHIAGREQFGKPLATFQAVAQQIADVYIVSRTVQLAARATAWGMDETDPAAVDDDLDVAGYWLTAELPKALQTCHHLHGGLGVDITYPMHRYYSAGKDLARLVGGRAARLDQLGDRCGSN